MQYMLVSAIIQYIMFSYAYQKVADIVFLSLFILKKLGQLKHKLEINMHIFIQYTSIRDILNIQIS